MFLCHEIKNVFNSTQLLSSRFRDVDMCLELHTFTTSTRLWTGGKYSIPENIPNIMSDGARLLSHS